MSNPNGDETLVTAMAMIGKLKPGEPIFILRGQDQIAAEVIRFWARRATQEGVDAAKVADALDDAKAFDAWPTKKLPD